MAPTPTLQGTSFIRGLVLVAALLLALPLAAPAGAVTVERVTSPAGIEAWLVRDHTNPITTMKFAFKGGTALDPDGKEGLANLVASTIDEGAGEMDSTAFQQALDARSITLRFSAGRDNVDGTLRTLNEHRDKAFDLLRLALTAPRFDADAVERIRAQIRSGIEQDRTDPDYQVRRRMAVTAFGDHPYAKPSDGTLASIDAITRDDLRDFAAKRFARDNLIVGVVGDIEPDTLAALLDTAFGALPATAAPWDLPAVTPTLTGGVQVIDIDVPQSAIQFAQPGMRRADPDFYTAYVLNYILGGGGFVSRLYEEVREKRGLAYSVYSYLMPLDRAGVVIGGAGTANARVGETVATVRAQWAKFAAEGPTEDELNDAKTFLTGNYPLRFTSSAAIAGTLVAMQDDDLGIDYIDRRNGYIEAVSMADAKRVARRLFQPGQLTFVIAGRPEGVGPTQ